MTEEDILRQQIAELQLENAELDEQVRLLVQIEHRLTKAQSQVDRQLARIEALSTFALSLSLDDPPLVVARRAGQLLEQWFAIDHVAILRADRAGWCWDLGDGFATVSAEPGPLLDRCLADAAFVEALATYPDAVALAKLVTPNALHDESVIAAIPLGDNGLIHALIGWRRPNPRASFFSEAPAAQHLPFLQLLGHHVGHALDVGMLTRTLRSRTEELAESNQRLQESLDSTRIAQERLMQAGKLEAIGKLAGGIAHDFNNLLTVILTNAELMRDGIPRDSPVLEDLDPIIDAGNRARDITRQLLLYSRKSEAKPEELRLESVVEKFARMAARLIGEQVRLRITHDPRVGTVRVDRTQLDQVLMNLVTNARDAMPGGGTVTIETRPALANELTECGATGARFVALVVSDTGEGMDDARRSQVFEPFFSTKAAGLGTGLGLAIVRSVVERAAGHILVDSAPGKGSRFVLLFPEASKPKPVQPLTTWKGTILLVEDEDAIRETVRRILTRRGYRVIEARNADEAVGLAASTGDFDLLLTDVAMPEVSGPELARRLKETRSRLPVLFISGYTFDAINESDLGPEEMLLSKPFTPDELATAVAQVLARPAVSRG